jgi:N-acetylneuraminate synthase
MAKCKLVIEIGINANGDIETVKKMIDIAVAAGADFVKFQKRTIETVYTKEELDAPRGSPWGTTNREQKQGLEMGSREYAEIDDHCKGRIRWFASPWDVESVKFLSYYNLPYIKVASPMLTNMGLLEEIRKIGRPVILSTGMSTIEMIDNAIDVVGKFLVHYILHCTSTYPSTASELNLRCIQKLKLMYPWAKIGFSNHHPGLVFMAAAAALEAEMIECHMTLDRSSYGSDQASSIEPEGIFHLAKWIKNIELAIGDGTKRIYDSEVPIMNKLRRL